MYSHATVVRDEMLRQQRLREEESERAKRDLLASPTLPSAGVHLAGGGDEKTFALSPVNVCVEKVAESDALAGPSAAPASS